MKYLLRIGETLYEVEVSPAEGGSFTLTFEGQRYQVELQSLGEQSFYTLVVDGAAYPLYVEQGNRSDTLVLAGAQFTVEPLPHAAAVLAEVRAQHPLARHSIFAVKAPMPGLIKAVYVQQGQEVTRGQRLLVLEAMKMNNEIRSPEDATVRSLPVVPDQRVNTGDLLVLLE